MIKKQPIIAVFGHTGVVGSATYNYYISMGHTVLGFSLDNETAPISYLSKVDFIFECVPTPFNWEDSKYDMSIVDEVVEKVSKHAKRDAVVILKSTMPPGSTDNLQSRYPDLNILFNPEFLTEATAESDFRNPDRQIIGYTKKSRKVAKKALSILPSSPYDVLITATEAEIIKYVNNFNGALMIIMGNLIYDMCQKLGQDFEIVRVVSQATRFARTPFDTYWNIFHGGYRGYGGKCFPKDMQNLLAWMHEQNIPCEILEATVNANRRLLEMQELSEPEIEEVVRRTQKDEIDVNEPNKKKSDNITLSSQ